VIVVVDLVEIGTGTLAFVCAKFPDESIGANETTDTHPVIEIERTVSGGKKPRGRINW
jgi:hypothetical protein